MSSKRTPLKLAALLVIGLGLALSLAAAGSAMWDARQPVSPFDQSVEGGASADFVPIIGPLAPAAGQGAALTLPAESITVNGLAFATPSAAASATPAAAVLTAGGTAATATAAPSATPLPIAIPDRIVIPAIQLDAPAVPAGLQEIEYQGQRYQQWVAPNKFAAGWLTTSATLGRAGNTVFSGHNNLHGEVFGHLQDLRVGDLVLVYSGTRQFAYVIALKMILRERFEPLAVRLANAEWIQPSTDERLTLVTCWPYESNTHRLILVARPVRVDRVELANAQVTPRLTPHPPLSWLATPSLPAANAP